MIGVVVCTHHTLAEALVQTVTQIVGTFEQLTAVAVEYGDPADQTLDSIRHAILEVDTGDGVVLLCDMFGGTPSNLSLSFLSEELEVVTGVNLPMLLKLFTARGASDPLAETAAKIRDEARDKILVAGELLRGQGKSE